MGLPFKPQLADRLNTITGCVRSDQLLDLTNQEILEELEGQGVVWVKRLRSRYPDRWGPNPTIRMGFKGLVLPQAIRCGYSIIQVQPWVPTPAVCRRCWTAGHTTRNCRHRQAVCGWCAGANTSQERESENGPLCPNCKNHAGWGTRRGIGAATCSRN